MPSSQSIPLTVLQPGEQATVRCHLMDDQESELLAAMGLTEQCKLKVCQQGEPCIIQVAFTRLGLSADMAKKILVDRTKNSEARAS